MRRIVVLSIFAAIAVGCLSLAAQAPRAAAPCLVCPDVPIPSECPTCYEWVPETCRQCGHCERIKGCKT